MRPFVTYAFLLRPLILFNRNPDAPKQQGPVFM
jgi:hypothetical protein